MTTPSVTGAAAATAAQTQAQPQTTGTDPIANEDVFLQLLVAQLKYQDPENPADGTQFVTQLAQFSTLEQSTEMRNDLDSINTVAQKFDPVATTASGATPPAGSSATTGASNPTNTNSSNS